LKKAAVYGVVLYCDKHKEFLGTLENLAIRCETDIGQAVGVAFGCHRQIDIAANR